MQDPFVITAAVLCQPLDTVQQVAQSWYLAHVTLHHPDGGTIEMLCGKNYHSDCAVVVQLLLRCFLTTWTAAHQASLPFTVSQSLCKLPSIELVMPFGHLILSHPFLLFLQYFPASGSFQMSQLFASGG